MHREKITVYNNRGVEMRKFKIQDIKLGMKIRARK